MTSFGEVRLAALAALRTSAWDANGYPLYCAMQDRHEHLHVGVYCNALSHIEALSEQLDYARWCDDLDMAVARGDSEDAEKLLRFYTTVFLLMEECHQDLVDIAATAGLEQKGPLDGLKGFVNNVLKHRRSHDHGVVGGFHVSNHHGPYYFADDAEHGAVLPPTYTSIENYGALKSGAVSALLIPSLVDSAAALAHAVAVAETETSTSAALAQIETEYGRAISSAAT
ncbi:hypothetical protein ACWKWP_05900 [Agromyces soli]